MVIDLAIATLPGPDGPFQLAVSARGVVAAESGISREAFEAMLRRRFGRRDIASSLASATRLAGILPMVESVLAGRTRDLSTIPLDLSDRPAFDQAVLRTVQEVPWGTTVSYGEVARRAGVPRAARAAGGAVARCPIAVLIPCHRVIAADGRLGGYGGDGPGDRSEALERKRRLLVREGITVAIRGD